MQRQFAVFDIDGTLCNSHLGVEFLKEMAGLDAIHGISRPQFDEQYLEWSQQEDRTAYYNKYFDDYYSSRLIGVGKEVFEEAGQKVARHAFAHFYTDVLSELQHHQHEGRFILIVSKSPEHAVREIAKLVHADDYWGWQFNFDISGKYIDQYTYPNGESDKATIIRRMMDAHSLTPDNSYGYGESNGDISMLQLVSHPTTVNPEPELLAVAQSNSWRVISTRESKPK